MRVYFPGVVRFDGSVLEEMEQGRLKWRDSFTYLHEKYLYKPSASQESSSIGNGAQGACMSADMTVLFWLPKRTMSEGRQVASCSCWQS